MENISKNSPAPKGWELFGGTIISDTITWRNCVPSGCMIIESQYHTCKESSDL